MKIEVIDSRWGADDETFERGVHEIAKPSAAFLRLVAGAEAAGAVVVVDAGAHRDKLDSYVQSQEAGETAQEAAQADGSWHDGNVAQFELDVANGVRSESIGGDA